MKKFILVLALFAVASTKIIVKLNEYSHASSPQLFSKHGKRVLLDSKHPKTFAVTKSYPNSVTRYIKLGLNGGKSYYNFEISTQQASSFIPATGCNRNCWPDSSNKNNDDLYKCEGLCTYKTTDSIQNIEFNKFSKQGPLKINTGFKGKDEVKVNKQFIAKQVELLLGTGFTNRNANAADGTIGFGYSKDKKNLISRLRANEVIKNSVFAFSVSETATFITIGASEKYFAAENPTTYDQPQNDERWQVKILNIKHNQENIAQPLHTANQVALIDATLDRISIPEAQFNNLKNFLTSKLGTDKCSSNSNGVFGCKCDSLSQLPKLEVSFTGDQNKYFTWNPSLYAEFNDGKCVLSVDYTTGTEWILGRRFLQHFYTVFDNDNAKIHIAQAKGISPQSHIMDDTTRGLVIGLGIALAIISIVALLVLLAPVQFTKLPQQQIIPIVKQVQVSQVQRPIVVQQTPIVYNQPIVNSQFRPNIIQSPQQQQQIQQSVQYVQRY